MKKYWVGVIVTGLALMSSSAPGHADELSIYDVQYTTDPSGASPYDGQTHNVDGGIVTHVWSGWQDRVYLQDPNDPDGWGAIVVKDWNGGLFSSVNLGDWVSFDNVAIDEYRGTTFLQYDGTGTYTIASTGNPVPEPKLFTAAGLAAPTYSAGPPPGWFVADHDSEPFESMVVTLNDVQVGAKDLGKASDNYELWQGTDVAWAADYMNVDAVGDYHPWIETGAEFESVTGIVEQYTRSYDPPADSWDYYQLLTRSTADLVPEPGTISLLLAGLVLVGRRRR